MRTAFLGFCLYQAVVGIVLYSDQYGSKVYKLHFARVQYSFSQAYRKCLENFSELSQHDIPNEFLNDIESITQISGDVWITDSQSSCMTIKRECKMMSSSSFGGGRCQEMHWVFEQADCSTSRRYIICMKDFSTSTTTSTTTILSTSTITTSPATTSTQPPVSTSRKKNEKADKELQPDMILNKPSMSAQVLSSFYLGIQLGSKDILGLIIGVTIGTFLIVMLVFVLCCACQGSTPKHQEKYELVMSEGTLSGGRHSEMSYTTQDCTEREVTTESSLESNQESSSHSRNSTPRNEAEVLYSSLATINRYKKKQNPLYDEEEIRLESPIISRRPKPSLALIKLPPPPPPLNEYTENPQSFVHSFLPDIRTYSPYSHPDDSSNSTIPRFNQFEETIDEETEDSDQEETCIKLVHPSMKKVLLNTVHVRPIIHQPSHQISCYEDDLPKDSSSLVSTFF